MPWTNKHQCRTPKVREHGVRGWFMRLSAQRPPGLVWKCPTCGTRWQLITRYGIDGRAVTEWFRLEAD